MPPRTPTLNVIAQAVESLKDIASVDWPGRMDDGNGGLFTSWPFLQALEASGSVGDTPEGHTGWQPHHWVLRDEASKRVLGAVPGYLKSHSYGEYVFDWAWADAYQRNGLAYYPKLLNASPFSPIPGSRLLLAEDSPLGIAELSKTWLDHAKQLGVSSAHCLLASEQERSALASHGALLRKGVQFHWHNFGYKTFDDFLASLTQSKRKKIKAERRKVADAGLRTIVLDGITITEADWDFFYRCYANTYREHHSTPYLTRQFFSLLGQNLPTHCVLVLALRGEKRVAASLLLKDSAALYGRYWGAIEHHDCLHFECAYYAPIQYAIEQGLKRIEGGAQGEHKLARGFTATNTGSAHWIADKRFNEAIARFLERESSQMVAYGDELAERSPLLSR